MAIEVTKTTVTKDAVETTANGRYMINFLVTEGELKSVRAEVYDTITVSVPSADGGTEAQQREALIGVLAMDNGIMRNNNFPYCEKYPLYVADFVNIVEQIIKG